MGALAEDDALLKLDGRSEGRPDHTRACRPFAENCGFTLAEASQFVILFDDELALELGANIYGSVADVFVNADGFKKSIPGPGIGNYLTVGKAMGVVRAILGDKALANNTYMQAHGTGTPQNRVTESHIFNALAKNFGIRQWPVTAIKAFLGHSLACASGDQIIASLGVWHDGIIPGIKRPVQLLRMCINLSLTSCSITARSIPVICRPHLLIPKASAVTMQPLRFCHPCDRDHADQTVWPGGDADL